MGDRPYDDVFGARSIGMRAVLRPNPLVPGFDVAPDATIQDLPELVALVRTWHGGVPKQPVIPGPKSA